MKQELVKKLQGGEDESGGQRASGVLQHHKDQTGKSAPPKKKDLLYCICKRPYDHTRYVIAGSACVVHFIFVYL